jgi:hypothetical protein
MNTHIIIRCAAVRKTSGYSPRQFTKACSPPSPDNRALPGPASVADEFLAGDRP